MTKENNANESKNNIATTTMAPHPLRWRYQCSANVSSFSTLMRYFSRNRSQSDIFFLSSVKILIFFTLHPHHPPRRGFRGGHLIKYCTTFTRFQLLEEIVALVVHKNKCREVLHFDFPDGFHSQFWILYAFNRLDIILC